MNLHAERSALIALLHEPHIMSWATLRASLDPGVLPTELLERATGPAAPSRLSTAAALLSQWGEAGTRFLTYLDDEYPTQLLDVHDFPPFIFARGKLLPPGVVDRSVSVVGSRDASEWAIRASRTIADGLLDHGVTVVAGLAAGVDAAAHETALRRQGRTVGIIGTGIRRQYPRTSAHLQLEMEQRGLVISQFWPDAAPARHAFPMRNAVMSAYSMATVIVQASEKSGTRHQATRAVRHGRPLILSRQVATETTWGEKLADDPHNDVHVADTPDAAVQLAVRCANRSVASAPTLPHLEIA